MKRAEFATLKTGDVIEVKAYRAGYEVWIVCSDPHDENTMIDAISEDGQRKGMIYFRDVIQKRKKGAN